MPCTRPVLLTLIVNWGTKPFTMLAMATFFLGYVFRGLVPGTEIVKDGTEVELFRSYISGAILLGIAIYVALPLVAGSFIRCWSSPSRTRRQDF